MQMLNKHWIKLKNEKSSNTNIFAEVAMLEVEYLDNENGGW